jgi:hypothetical protein
LLEDAITNARVWAGPTGWEDDNWLQDTAPGFLLQHNGMPMVDPTNGNNIWDFRTTQARETWIASIVNDMVYQGAVRVFNHGFCCVRVGCIGLNDMVYQGAVRVFRQKFTLDDAIGSHACSLEALA